MDGSSVALALVSTIAGLGCYGVALSIVALEQGSRPISGRDASRSGSRRARSRRSSDRPARQASDLG